MLKICFLFIIAAIYLSTGDASEIEFIVGGTNAEEGEFPYQISLQKNKTHYCGGSILNSCWILTSARCVAKYNQSALVDILAGTTKLNSSGVRVGIEKVIPHEKYKSPYTNDIALIKLKTCLTLNKSTIKNVKILTNYIEGGALGIVTGWGYTDQSGTEATNDLKKLTVKTISNEDCKKGTRLSIPDEDLCTWNKAGEGFCRTDAGGPLVDEKSKAQIGIVSTNLPCARGYPEVYTRVSAYIEWLKTNVKK